MRLLLRSCRLMPMWSHWRPAGDAGMGQAEPSDRAEGGLVNCRRGDRARRQRYMDKVPTAQSETRNSVGTAAART